MTGRTMLLPVVRCRACGRNYVPVPLVQRQCDVCLEARAAARAAAKVRQAGYWRAWADRQLDAIDTSAAGDVPPALGGGQ